MQFNLVVHEPFGSYKKGDRITDAATVQRVLESGNAYHVIKTAAGAVIKTAAGAVIKVAAPPAAPSVASVPAGGATGVAEPTGATVTTTATTAAAAMAGTTTTGSGSAETASARIAADIEKLQADMKAVNREQKG